MHIGEEYSEVLVDLVISQHFVDAPTLLLPNTRDRRSMKKCPEAVMTLSSNPPWIHLTNAAFCMEHTKSYW